MNINPGTG